MKCDCKVISGEHDEWCSSHPLQKAKAEIDRLREDRNIAHELLDHLTKMVFEGEFDSSDALVKYVTELRETNKDLHHEMHMLMELGKKDREEIERLKRGEN